MLKLSIPKPCHEDWSSMTPNEQGRHCAVCAKTVTDFTQMSNDEVKQFFLKRKNGERTCGRFTTQQLNHITIELPANIYYISMPWWKKFLTACLIIFGTTLFSCNTNIKGKVVNAETRTTGIIATPPQQQTLLRDTIMPYDIKGEPVMIDTNNKNKCSNIITVTGEETIVGKPEFVPPPPQVVQGTIAVIEPDIKEVNQIEPPKKDTLQKKDSTNCNTQKFY